MLCQARHGPVSRSKHATRALPRRKRCQERVGGIDHALERVAGLGDGEEARHGLACGGDAAEGRGQLGLAALQHALQELGQRRGLQGVAGPALARLQILDVEAHAGTS